MYLIDKFKRTIELRTPVSDELWGRLKASASEICVKKNRVLIPYSSSLQKAYFLAKGSFECSLITTDGDRQTVWFFLDEVFDVVVCMDSYFLGEPTKYEVTALEDSIVYKFEKKVVDAIVLEYPEFNKFYREDIIDDYIKLNEIRNHMVAKSPEAFLRYLKDNYPAILNRAPSKNLAHFMGITPEWYSKLKKKLSSVPIT
ncbi:MAG: cyclic nucleotide-binding domain-containing protein [Bacteroidota bacterium]